MTKESDWEALVAFDQKCYPAAWCVDTQWYHESYERGYLSWLLFVGEVLAGNFQLRQHDTSSMYISGIAVLPEFQEHGLGRELLEKLVELYGGSRLVARVHVENTRARGLFLSSGFTSTHDQVDDKGKWNWFERLPTQ